MRAQIPVTEPEIRIPRADAEGVLGATPLERGEVHHGRGSITGEDGRVEDHRREEVETTEDEAVVLLRQGLHEGAVALDANALEHRREDPAENRALTERGDQPELALVHDGDPAIGFVLAVVHEVASFELLLVGRLDGRLEDLVDDLADVPDVDLHLRQEPREADAAARVLHLEQFRDLIVGRNFLLQRTATVLDLAGRRQLHSLREIESAALHERIEVELRGRLLPCVVGVESNMIELESLRDHEADMLVEKPDDVLDRRLLGPVAETERVVAPAHRVDEGEEMRGVEASRRLKDIVHAIFSLQALSPKSVVPLTPGPEGRSSD